MSNRGFPISDCLDPINARCSTALRMDACSGAVSLPRIVGDLGGLDLSPIVLLLVIWFFRDVLRRLTFEIGV